jgi:hypothetical protein
MGSSIAAGFRFDEIRIGSLIYLFALMPVASAIIILQLFVPTAEVARIIATEYPRIETPNPQIYLLYLTSDVVHIIVATLVIFILRRRLRENISPTKLQAFERAIYFFIVLTVALFLISDSLSPNLATLSHARVYKILEHSPLFSPYFKAIPGDLVVGRSFPGPYFFSILPGGLIILGLIVAVLTCFMLGRDLWFVTNSLRPRPTASKRKELDARLTASKREELDARIRGFQNYFYALSAVLITSSISTGLYFRLPLTTIAPGDAYASFRDVSTAMTICWGVTFSLTMFVMCFYPYFRIQKDLRALLKESKVANDIELQRWLDDIKKDYVVQSNLTPLLSMFLPAAVALLSRFI